jgi:dTDP-4-amino-4,6-dideoxygalactose transaminase
VILKFVHSIAERALFYDWIQLLFGALQVHAHAAKHVPATGPGEYVLDVGGGTGNFRKYWPANCRYVCLDLEIPKLHRFLRGSKNGIAIQADATQLPIPHGSVHAVVCKFVAHHLSREMLERVLKECARPVFADIRPDTLNLDETRLAERITPKTKAIVVVHYAGVGCEMDSILDTAKRRGIVVIEDNAHGLFAAYRGNNLGTFGALATLSFHETKNISCGEGGALLINDPNLVERAEILRDKGTNRARFFRGQVDKYTWVDRGSSFLPSDLLAAFLFAQLEALERIQEIRERIWQRYNEGLKEFCAERGWHTPHVPAHCRQSYHMYYLLVRSLEQRQALIAHLRSRGIMAVFHYVPLHLSDMGRQLGGVVGMCPQTEDISDRLIRLPFYNGLTEIDQERVIDAVLAFPA